MGLERQFRKCLQKAVPMIIIHPYAKKLVNGKENPKNYPYWKELIALIDEPIIQIGVEGEEQLVDDFRKNLPISELSLLLKHCKTWIGVDSFFQHLAWSEGKQGIVLWSVSDPLIFGHHKNINLLKSRDYLAKNQFLWWDLTEYNSNAFVNPEEVIKFIQIHPDNTRKLINPYLE
jgi:ADP-heptose:LPS heptosyltransferase